MDTALNVVKAAKVKAKDLKGGNIISMNGNIYMVRNVVTRNSGPSGQHKSDLCVVYCRFNYDPNGPAYNQYELNREYLVDTIR